MGTLVQGVCKARVVSGGGSRGSRARDAEITYATLEQYQDRDAMFNDLSAHYSKHGDKTYMIPVGASDEVGLWGYIECARELKKDFETANISPGAIVSATGSGGTLGGLIIGNQLHALSTKVLAFNVCDDEAYFVNKLREDFRNWERRYQGTGTADLPITAIDGYVGPGYGKATQNVFDTIRKVAVSEGIILDPVYTGKAFDAMLQEIGKGRFQNMSDIVFLHTGGIFGLFPQRAQFF